MKRKIECQTDRQTDRQRDRLTEGELLIITDYRLIYRLVYSMIDGRTVLFTHSSSDRSVCHSPLPYCPLSYDNDKGFMFTRALKRQRAGSYLKPAADGRWPTQHYDSASGPITSLVLPLPHSSSSIRHVISKSRLYYSLSLICSQQHLRTLSRMYVCKGAGG